MDAKTLLYNSVYVVLMRRWGAEEGHHYIVGVYSTQEQAEKVAEEERDNRGGKYEWLIECHSLDDAHLMKGIHRVARSKEMGCLTDTEQREMFKGVPTSLDEIEKYEPSNEWYEYCSSLDFKKLKEELTQEKSYNDELRKEIIELRKELNGRKEV